MALTTEEREALASWLYEWVNQHNGTDLRDAGHSLVLECRCGKALGITYSPTETGSADSEALAYFAHQADDLTEYLAARPAPASTDEWAAAHMLVCHMGDICSAHQPGHWPHLFRDALKFTPPASAATTTETIERGGEVGALAEDTP